MRKFKEMAKVVKDHREKSEYTPYHLSQKIGYKNGQFFSNVERELCTVPDKYLMQTSEVLKCDVELLIAAKIADTASNIRRGVFGGN